jgi:hypothetical protein
MFFYSLKNPSLNENCQQERGGQLQPMDEDDKGL